MKTNALVIAEPERVDLREVELTPPGADDVVIRTAYTSISAGTERMLLAGRMPHPMLSFPVIPGYETVGQVIGRGENAPPELEGQWVYIGGARCFTGVNPAWGGQAATLIADHRRVVPLGELKSEQGVLLALAATALHGVDVLARSIANHQSQQESETLAPPMPNDLEGKRVLVLGQGPVGQIAARLAKARGAWVAAVDTNPSRLYHAQGDMVGGLDAAQDQRLIQQALTASVDAIIEATGSMAALSGALGALANNGTILLLGYYDELHLPYMPLFLKQARLLTAKEWGPNDLVRCRDLMTSGALDIARLITHRLPVQHYQEAYRIALGELECLKLVLEWGTEV